MRGDAIAGLYSRCAGYLTLRDARLRIAAIPLHVESQSHFISRSSYELRIGSQNISPSLLGLRRIFDTGGSSATEDHWWTYEHRVYKERRNKAPEKFCRTAGKAFQFLR
jgi:hypothetical protein